MPKRVSIEPKLTLAELEARYRKAADGVERSQWQIIWLLAQGKTTAEVAKITGYSVSWIRQVAGRYNRDGIVGDMRRNNPGVKALLSREQQLELWQALQGGAPDGGLWNSRKVAQWIENNTGKKKVYLQRGWEYLKKLGFSLKHLRPRHEKASAEQQEAFKKSSSRQ
jgi:transposase